MNNIKNEFGYKYGNYFSVIMIALTITGLIINILNCKKGIEDFYNSIALATSTIAYVVYLFFLIGCIRRKREKIRVNGTPFWWLKPTDKIVYRISSESVDDNENGTTECIKYVVKRNRIITHEKKLLFLTEIPGSNFFGIRKFGKNPHVFCLKDVPKIGTDGKVQLSDY